MDMLGPNGHYRSRSTPIPEAKKRDLISLHSRTVFVCHTNEELMMKMRTMTLRIGSERGKINSRDLNQPLRVRSGADRILHVRAENQVRDWVLVFGYGYGFGYGFLFFFSLQNLVCHGLSL